MAVRLYGLGAGLGGPLGGWVNDKFGWSVVTVTPILDDFRSLIFVQAIRISHSGSFQNAD